MGLYLHLGCLDWVSSKVSFAYVSAMISNVTRSCKSRMYNISINHNYKNYFKEKKKQDSKVPFAMIIFRITDSQHWVTGSISSVKLLSIPFRQSRKCMHSENIMKEWLKKPCFDIKH